MGHERRTTRLVPAFQSQMELFSRQELREYANRLGVEVGRNKSDVVRNLAASGKASMWAKLNP